MSSDFFRILRGLEIDETVTILQGAIPPGSTTDTNNCLVGSFYLNSATGTAYTKVASGSGPSKWSAISETNLQLYNENDSGIITPPTAQGDGSIALGSGAETSVSAPYSLAVGDQALSRIQGGVVQASGRFGNQGDAQTGRYLLRTVTVNNIFTEAFVDGTAGSIRLVLPDDSTWTFNATITGHRTDVLDGHVGFNISGVIYRAAGAATVALQGAINKTVIARSDASWNVTINADNVNGSLQVMVKGQNSKTIRWLALVETVEITN